MRKPFEITEKTRAMENDDLALTYRGYSRENKKIDQRAIINRRYREPIDRNVRRFFQASALSVAIVATSGITGLIKQTSSERHSAPIQVYENTKDSLEAIDSTYVKVREPASQEVHEAIEEITHMQEQDANRYRSRLRSLKYNASYKEALATANKQFWNPMIYGGIIALIPLGVASFFARACYQLETKKNNELRDLNNN